jgi:CBS domain-containing protein
VPAKTAAEIMDATVPTVSPDADARSAVELLAKTDKGAIPVVDEERNLIGIVSESDLILGDEEADLHLPLFFDLMGSPIFLGSIKHFEERLDKAFATKVSELMTAEPEAVSIDDDAETVARRVAETHHNHLPVVDGDRRLAGLVTRADALAALVDS